MQWRDVKFGDRQVRQFSALCVLLAGMWLLRSGLSGSAAPLEWLAAGFVAALSGLGLIRPVVMRPVYIGAMLLTFPIGWLISRLLLAVVYFGVITPIGLFFRLRGRDVLGRAFDSNRASYWEPAGAAPEPRSYLRQF